MSDPAYQALLERISKARAEGKSFEQMMQMVTEFLAAQPAEYDSGRRDELLAQVKLLATQGSLMETIMNAAKSGDEAAGMKGLLTLYANMQAAQPKEAIEAKRNQFFESMAKAQGEMQKRRAAHKKARLAKGLCEEAGTGTPEPEVLLHGIAAEDLPTPTNDTTDFDDPVFGCIPLGYSRLGGLPDLPPGVQWPTHGGKKIPFVAQIDLSILPPTAHKLLPKDGHLFAFALISNEDEHWPPPCSVFLYRGPAASLVRVKKSPKDSDLWADWTDVRVYDSLPATTTPKGRDPKKRSREFGETLGWVLGEMDGVFGTAGEIADKRFQDGDDWINLLALESEGSMQWSDCGHLYLLIRRSALEKLDFSNVLAAVGSS